MRNAARLMQQAGYDAVKPQVGGSQAHVLPAPIDAGILTASHIRLTPHTIAMFGGVQGEGRTAEAAMINPRRRTRHRYAGGFMLELEAVPGPIAA